MKGKVEMLPWTGVPEEEAESSKGEMDGIGIVKRPEVFLEIRQGHRRHP